jgi:hypothetical protein
MRRLLCVSVCAAAAALGLAAPAAAAQQGPVGQGAALAAAPSRNVSITVVGIDRTGVQVAVQSTVVPLAGNAVPSTGPKYTLAPGTYFIGASVPTMAGSNLASQTIVIRRVRVAASGTVSLDARGGKLVSVSLNADSLGSPGLAGGCIRGGRGVVYPEPAASLLYVKPVRDADIGFDWTVNLPGPNGSTYDLAGGSAAGLPGSPVFRVRTSGLAKTVVEVRAGTVPDTTATWSTTATEPDGCSLPGARGTEQLPFRVTDYRTPGAWRTGVQTSHGQTTCSMTWADRKYRAGQGYTVSFGNASRGPTQAIPLVLGKMLTFDPNDQFADPLAPGYEYCAGTTVSLSHDGRTLKTEHFTNLLHSFSAVVRSGWYVLRVNARQTTPGEARPVGLLSPRTSLTWRFKVALGAIPVAVMSFLPKGLTILNQAAPRSTTTVRVWPTQSQYRNPPGPGSRARRFAVQVSFDGGHVWRTVPVIRHSGFWTFSVHNPAAGFVAFRSVTVSAAGDSSVQTVYNAYGIR